MNTHRETDYSRNLTQEAAPTPPVPLAIGDKVTSNGSWKGKGTIVNVSEGMACVDETAGARVFTGTVMNFHGEGNGYRGWIPLGDLALQS